MEDSAKEVKDAQLKKIALKKKEDEEKEVFNKQKIKFFKGTITIIVIYAVFMLAMSTAGILSEKARRILFEDGFAFTVTFISGTIIIIIMLIVELYNYKQPPKPPPFAGENLSCPDFWVLKKTPSEVLDTLKGVDSRLKELSRFYCENPSVVGVGSAMTIDNGSGSARVGIGTNTGMSESASTKLSELNTIGKKYNETLGPSSTYHMNCDRIYPDYMAYIDKKEFPDNPTEVRCEYINQCKSTAPAGNNKVIPWTSVCKKT